MAAEAGTERPEDDEPPAERPPDRAAVSLREALRAWSYVGLNSFGGPAGQIAVIHGEIVERRRWLGEQRFLHALNYCMLLPGPEAQQLATYVGWLLNGVRGGLLAGLLFVLPGVLSILALSIVYAVFRDTTVVQALFYGIKPAVIAVVAVAVVRIGRRALRDRVGLPIAASAFAAMFFFDVPFPLIVLAAAGAGFALSRPAGREILDVPEAESAVGGAPRLPDEPRATALPRPLRSLTVLLVGLLLWLGPLGALLAVLGPQSVFVHEGLFFSTAAVVTFGGAYAVLAFVAQQAVEVFGWLSPAEMLDGLGLAESTPGPLIMVVQFVGFLAAFRQPGELDPILAGVLGALLVSWVTFAPSFLWIFLGAPYAEHLRQRRQLAAALAGISAAVVGVIGNLAAWFALQTLFGVTGKLRLGALRLHTVELETLDPAGLVLTVLAFVALVRLRWPLLLTLAASAGLGFAYYLLSASP